MPNSLRLPDVTIPLSVDASETLLEDWLTNSSMTSSLDYCVRVFKFYSDNNWESFLTLLMFMQLFSRFLSVVWNLLGLNDTCFDGFKSNFVFSSTGLESFSFEFV